MKSTTVNLTGFVNCNGEVFGLVTAPPTKPKAKVQAGEYHKGFRVVGIPPGALTDARENRRREIEMAKSSGGRVPQPFNEDLFLAGYRKKPVRSKPYELKAAADTCAAIATKAGWLRVEVEERSKGEAQPLSF